MTGPTNSNLNLEDNSSLGSSLLNIAAAAATELAAVVVVAVTARNAFRNTLDNPTTISCLQTHTQHTDADTEASDRKVTLKI